MTSATRPLETFTGFTDPEKTQFRCFFASRKSENTNLEVSRHGTSG